MEREQGREQEQPVAAVRRAEEGGVLERGSYDMMDSALYVPTNSSIAELFSHFEGTLHQITDMHYQLQARLDSIVASQKTVLSRVDFLCGKKNNHFSCNDTFSCGSTFENPVDFPEEGITTVVTTRRPGKQLPTRSNETESKPPANSPEEDYSYYRQFQPRLRDGPAAVNLGAHAGLNNSNVNCYSNAVFQ